MSIVNSAMMRPIALRYLLQKYGFIVEPRCASEVTITSLTNSFNDIKPGCLFVPIGNIEMQEVLSAQTHGAYAIVLPTSMREVVAQCDMSIPIIYADLSAHQLGMLAGDIAGNPANSLAIFGISSCAFLQNYVCENSCVSERESVDFSSQNSKTGNQKGNLIDANIVEQNDCTNADNSLTNTRSLKDAELSQRTYSQSTMIGGNEKLSKKNGTNEFCDDISYNNVKLSHCRTLNIQSYSDEHAASAVRLSDVLHMLGNPVACLNTAHSYSVSRALPVDYPLDVVGLQHMLSICVEDGAAAVVISLDDSTLQHGALYGVGVDIVGICDGISETPKKVNKVLPGGKSMQKLTVKRLKKQSFATNMEEEQGLYALELLQKEYGFTAQNQSAIVAPSEESLQLAQLVQHVPNQESLQRLALAISMSLSAGIKKSNIKASLRVQYELEDN